MEKGILEGELRNLLRKYAPPKICRQSEGYGQKRGFRELGMEHMQVSIATTSRINSWAPASRYSDELHDPGL